MSIAPFMSSSRAALAAWRSRSCKVKPERVVLDCRVASLLAMTGILALAVFIAAPAMAGKPKHDMPSTATTQDLIADIVFTEIERRLMCDYFKVMSCGTKSLLGDGKQKHKGDVGSGDKTAMLPPGLAKRNELPPGLERQYQRNGKLPPGLQKRQLPDDLARALPRRSHDFERVIVGNDVLLISIATGVVLDILEGVAAGR